MMGEEEKSDWGGARQGAGRPKGRTKKQYNWYLNDEEKLFLKECLDSYRKGIMTMDDVKK